MKKLLLIALLVLAFGTTNAHAVGLTFDLDGLWDWGTTYQAPVGGLWPVDPSAVNPYYGTTSQPLADRAFTAPDGKEDSYGIARVNSIVTDDGNLLFDRSTSAFELTTFFWGFDDVFLSGTFTDSLLLSTNGHAAMYMDYSKNYNAVVPLDPGTGRTAVDQFTKVTDGTKVLDLTTVLRLHTDIVSLNSGTYTMKNDFNFDTQSGFGDVLFDVTGGAWASQFDTDTQDLGSDIKLNFASFPNTTNSRWLVKGVGNAKASAVPEPASMLLFATGLIGAALRKRFV